MQTEGSQPLWGELQPFPSVAALGCRVSADALLLSLRAQATSPPVPVCGVSLLGPICPGPLTRVELAGLEPSGTTQYLLRPGSVCYQLPREHGCRFLGSCSSQWHLGGLSFFPQY